jgi:O-methyltransferase
MIKRIKKAIVSNLYKKEAYLGYDFYQDIKNSVKVVKDYSMMPHINLATLYEQVVYCEKNSIKGDYVECGVWKGGAVGIMALANLKYSNQRRNLHLFDAFDDICPPDISKDGNKAIEDVKKYGKLKNFDDLEKNKPIKGIYDSFGGHGRIEDCNNLLSNLINYPKENIFYYKGWFEETLPEAKIEDIAILRLDGDWYDSIKICLDKFYDRVTVNGIVIIDDYGYYEGCTKAVDDFFKERGIVNFLSYSNFGCRFFIKN